MQVKQLEIWEETNLPTILGQRWRCPSLLPL